MVDRKAFSSLRPEPPDPRHYDPVAEVGHCGVLLERALQIAANRDPSFVTRILRIAYRLDAALGFDQEATVAATLLDFEHPYPVHHSLQKAIWAGLLLRLSGEEEDTRVEAFAAALTANISILSLQQQLEHQTTPLDDDQRKRLRLHPKLSAEMLRKLNVEAEGWLQAVEQHHERLDGSGYPQRVEGDDVSRMALALAFGDEFSAMITPRGFRTPHAPSEALVEVGRSCGDRFPADFIQLLLSALGVYMPGSLVKLKDTSLGVVVRRGRDPRLPQVSILENRVGQRLYRPMLIDLDEPQAPKLQGTLPLDAITLPVSLSVLYGYR